jgi:hypothetical protein
MKSATLGRSTSGVEVTNISPHGFWLLLGQREIYLPFTEFPWFREATIAQITHLELLSPNHLYWPTLDVDLSVESIENPAKFPLISGQRGGACS